MKIGRISWDEWSAQCRKVHQAEAAEELDQVEFTRILIPVTR